jgi:biopolymer transport protein ExbD
VRFSSRSDFKKTKIEIIPMIDTMFFLLVFFILASLNVIDVKGSQVDLPDSKNQDPQAQARLTVTIKQNGEIGINNKVTVTDPNADIGRELMVVLSDELTQVGSGAVVDPDNAVVIINADKRATASMIRRCLDDARRSRFRKFSIATDPRTYVE